MSCAPKIVTLQTHMENGHSMKIHYVCRSFASGKTMDLQNFLYDQQVAVFVTPQKKSLTGHRAAQELAQSSCNL